MRRVGSGGQRGVDGDRAVAPPVDRYAEIHAAFRWAVPERFNIAEVCCARWARATPDAVAIRWEHEDGRTASFTYADLQRDANRLAHALARRGVGRGDRVAIVMPQRFETAVAHIALYQLGAIAMPLSMLFGPEALEYRINHSEARLAIVDESGIANVLASRPLPAARDRARGRRGRRPGRRRLERRARRGIGDLRAGRDRRRRCRGADLHQRHHRPAQRRADPAPRADRQPQRLCLQPELVWLRWHGQYVVGGRFLEPGRLGLDRRADGCALADALFRPRDRRLPGPLRARDGVRADAAPRRDPHVPVPDRAEGDDEGGARAAPPPPAEARSDHERRRGGRRRGV